MSRLPPARSRRSTCTLAALRGQIGEIVVHRPAGYELAAGDYELDARNFTALLAQARDERSDGRPLLAQALALFRGERSQTSSQMAQSAGGVGRSSESVSRR